MSTVTKFRHGPLGVYFLKLKSLLTSLLDVVDLDDLVDAGLSMVVTTGVLTASAYDGDPDLRAGVKTCDAVVTVASLAVELAVDPLLSFSIGDNPVGLTDVLFMFNTRFSFLLLPRNRQSTNRPNDREYSNKGASAGVCASLLAYPVFLPLISFILSVASR